MPLKKKLRVEGNDNLSSFIVPFGSGNEQTPLRGTDRIDLMLYPSTKGDFLPQGNRDEPAQPAKSYGGPKSGYWQVSRDKSRCTSIVIPSDQLHPSCYEMPPGYAFRLGASVRRAALTDASYNDALKNIRAFWSERISTKLYLISTMDILKILYEMLPCSTTDSRLSWHSERTC